MRAHALFGYPAGRLGAGRGPVPARVLPGAGVHLVTAKSDNEPACAAVNATLAHLVEGVANAELFDWKAAAADRPELFYSDQTHLRPVGARFYATALLNQIDLHMERIRASPR
jgi:hypothetical protein